MTKQETVELLKQQLPGFYSVEQVIEMINGIEEVSSNPLSPLTENEMEELASNIASSVAGEGTDLISDYELSMSYREVELDSVDLDESTIEREALRAIKDFFEERATN